MTLVVAATFFAAVAGLVAYQLGYQRALDSGRATLEGLLTAVEKTASIGAYTSDKVLLQEVIDGLARHDLVALVEVRSPQGALVVSKQSMSLAHAAGDLSDRQVVKHQLASPFDVKESVGEVRIEADMARLQASARREASVLSLVMVGQTVLLSILLYLMAERLVSRPIVRLAGRLRRMAPGSREQLEIPPGHEDDEIGALVESANVLLQTNREALHNERELRAEIEKMEARYRQIFDASSAGIFVLDSDRRLVNCNPTALALLGLKATDMKQLQSTDLVRMSFARPDHVRYLIDESLHHGTSMEDDLELANAAAAAHWVHCLISAQKVGEDRWIEGVIYDVTERKRSEDEAQHLAEHDALTGLRNRRACDAVIDRVIDEATEQESPVSVLYIDLDGFKRVNDELGHKAGDQVLQQCAQRLHHALRRTSDVLGRIGGDEFVMYLHQADAEGAKMVAQRVLESLAQPFHLDDVHFSVNCSIGVAM
ncbi:MAG: diguanylate cyclase, partial [Pseudomonadota bacterium]